MKTYKCTMYTLGNKSERLEEIVRYIKASSREEAKRKWTETQIGSFELAEIEEMEGKE